MAIIARGWGERPGFQWRPAITRYGNSPVSPCTGMSGPCGAMGQSPPQRGGQSACVAPDHRRHCDANGRQPDRIGPCEANQRRPRRASIPDCVRRPAFLGPRPHFPEAWTYFPDQSGAVNSLIPTGFHFEVRRNTTPGKTTVIRLADPCPAPRAVGTYEGDNLPDNPKYPIFL